MYENRSDLYSLTDTKITKPTEFFVQRLYSFYVSRSGTIRFRVEKTYVFASGNVPGFHAENIKQTKPKQHYLQQTFQSYQTKKSPEVPKRTSGDFKINYIA